MSFLELDKIINEHLEQNLKSYLDVDSLENYNIKIDSFISMSQEVFFNHYLDLSYEVVIKKEKLSVIASSANKKSSLVYRYDNQTRNLYDFLDRQSFEFFNKIKELQNKSNKYVLTVEDKTKKNVYKICVRIYRHGIANAYFTFKKNYLLLNYKESEEIPEREDDTYVKIEKIRPCELTYKIFYELAVRNKNVKKIMNALDYLYAIKKVKKHSIIKINEVKYKVINDEGMYTLNGKILGSDIYNHHKIFVSFGNLGYQCIVNLNGNSFKIQLYQEMLKKDLNLSINFAEVDYQTSKKSFGLPLASCNISITNSIANVKNKKNSITLCIDNEIKSFTIIEEDGSWGLELDAEDIFTQTEFLQKYSDFLEVEEHEVYLKNLQTINDLIEEFEKELIDNYLIYPKNSSKNTEKNKILIQRVINNSSKKKDAKYFFNENEYEGYSIHQGFLKGSSNYDVNTIKPDTLKDVVDCNITNIQVNMNLPKKELIDYISKIKDNYDNDNSILKTPMELLGEKSDISSENIKNMDSFEWADTLYIYDHYNKNIEDNETDKKSRIKVALTCYRESFIETKIGCKSIKEFQKKYSNKKKSSSKEYCIEIDTIKARYKLMQALIEQEKYKHLILGKK